MNRHAITDMEFTAPEDLKRMGELGVIGEIYFQIMSLILVMRSRRQSRNHRQGTGTVLLEQEKDD